MQIKLLRIEDPSHAWVRVPWNILVDLKLSSSISPMSYVDSDFVYLEQNHDARIFYATLKKQNILLQETVERYEYLCFVRSLDVFKEAIA